LRVSGGLEPVGHPATGTPHLAGQGRGHEVCSAPIAMELGFGEERDFGNCHLGIILDANLGAVRDLDADNNFH